MTESEKSTLTAIPNIVRIMDVAAFIETMRNELPEAAHFTIAFDKGEPTIAFDIPNSISEDFSAKLKVMGDLVYLLLEQAAKHGIYQTTECDDEGKHDRWDVTTA